MARSTERREGLCFDKCAREAEACGGTLADCEYQCSISAEGCETEQLELDRCQVEAPVVCDTGGEPAALPCCEPLVTLLRCVGYDGEGCPEE